MRAGFARANINPPIGTRMSGWDARDREGGCESIHDDLWVRALWLSHGEENALILGFDLLFFSRDVADRLRGAVGRRFGLCPRQVLLNTSHTHAGPNTGTWASALHVAPDRLYLDKVERAVLQATEGARVAAREVTLSAGVGKSSVALNRRKIDENGHAQWAANPGGAAYEDLPVCLLEDSKGEPVCLLFSVSCHPSTFGGFEVSADFPGVAMSKLDQHLGKDCSLFLQGVGGDTKVKSYDDARRFGGDWGDVERAGEDVAGEVIRTIRDDLTPIRPTLRAASMEIELPTHRLPTRADLELVVADPSASDLKRQWANRMLSQLKRGEHLPETVPITMHGVRFGEEARLVGLEGEAVAGLGLLIRDFYGSGITFPLGYTDGCQLYLPTTRMLDEHGYEVDSYFEYGFPAGLAPGIEQRILDGLSRLRDDGIL